MTSRIHRHPDEATLLAFAAGTLSEALSAAIAAHVAMCDHCRADVRDMERMGEALLGAMAPAGDDATPLAVPALPAEPERAGRGRPDVTDVADDRLPSPLVRRYNLTYDTIPWRLLAPGIWHHRLSVAPGGGDLRLLRIARGLRMPEHGHGGAELTLVLDGAYSDETGRYGRGDVQDVDEDVEHRPIADPAVGCVCLIASERPARFKGLISRMMQPLTGL